MAPNPIDYYSRDWYESSRDLAWNSAEVMFGVLRKVLKVSSLVDVGFGSGGWLRCAALYGADPVVGIDGPWNQNEFPELGVHLRYLDLSVGGWSDKFRSEFEKVDLAVCLEVAEHLPERAAAALVQDLTKVSDAVCFGAAIVGQGGTLHLNERPQSFWAELFNEQSFVAFDIFRSDLWNDEEVAPYYVQNTLLYVRRESDLERYLKQRAFLSSDGGLLLDIVHPAILAQKVAALGQQSIRFRLKSLVLNLRYFVKEERSSP